MKLTYTPELEPDQLVEELQALQSKCIQLSKTSNPAELEYLSVTLVSLPKKLGEFGWYLSEVESDLEEVKEDRDRIYDEEVMKLLRSTDPDTNKTYAANKAEKIARLSDEYQGMQQEYLRVLRTQKTLKRKYEAYNKFFDGVRSRVGIIRADSERIKVT